MVVSLGFLNFPLQSLAEEPPSTHLSFNGHRGASPLPHKATSTLMRALVVDDQEMFRELFAKAFRSSVRPCSVQECCNLADARCALEAATFDYVILDVLLPDGNGLSLCEQFARVRSHPRFIAISAFWDDVTILRALHSDAAALIDKHSQAFHSISNVLTEVSSGRRFLSETIAQRCSWIKSDPHSPFKILSKREFWILCNIAAGASNDEIASKLVMSPFTVQWHRRRIMAKLGIHTSVDLVRYAIETGFAHNVDINPDAKPLY